MSFLSAALGNRVSGFEAAFGNQDITSGAMKQAIRVWFDLYFSDSATDEEDRCQRLPYVVVNKLYKAVFSEYEADATGPKADFMGRTLRNLNEVKKKAMQFALVGGECFLKPVPAVGCFEFAVVRRDCYLALSRDGKGRPTSVGCAERSAVSGFYYTLLEKRAVGADGRLTIENRLYKSNDKSVLGGPVPLSALAQYAALEPRTTLELPCGLGMALLKTPMENCVDGSDDGVAVYAPAVGLIHNINRNERQINDEFENGASRIIASSDLMDKDERGNRKLTEKQFVGVDDDPDRVGITIFSPSLREQSYLARKQEYLRNIETQIGLKRGILSEIEAVERTATEITSSAGDYNLTILDFQQMWEFSTREVLGICDTLGRMYQMCGTEPFDPEKDVVIGWGDGVLFNRDKAWAERKEQVASGILKPELALAWYYDLPHDTPKDLAKIRADYMPELESMLADDIPLSGGDQYKSAPESSAGDVVEAAEDVAGKTLNGAQTQSLVAVIAQVQANQLTVGQAVNIIAVAIGISKEEARKIIEGAD